MYLSRSAAAIAAFAVHLLAVPLLYLRDGLADLIFGRVTDHHLSIEAETLVRTRFVTVRRLPSWTQFLAFIARAQRHRESIGGGFYPEVMRARAA